MSSTSGSFADGNSQRSGGRDTDGDASDATPPSPPNDDNIDSASPRDSISTAKERATVEQEQEQEQEQELGRGKEAANADPPIRPLVREVLETYTRIARHGYPARTETRNGHPSLHWTDVTSADFEQLQHHLRNPPPPWALAAAWHTDSAREDYSAEHRLLRLRMPSNFHDSLCTDFGQDLLERLRTALSNHPDPRITAWLQQNPLRFPGSGQLYIAPKEKRSPDYVLTFGTRHPCAIVENGWSHPASDDFAFDYIEKTEGDIRLVIRFDVDYVPPKHRPKLSDDPPALRMSVFRLVSTGEIDPSTNKPVEEPVKDPKDLLIAPTTAHSDTPALVLSLSDFNPQLAEWDPSFKLTYSHAELRRLLHLAAQWHDQREASEEQNRRASELAANSRPSVLRKRKRDDAAPSQSSKRPAIPIVDRNVADSTGPAFEDSASGPPAN